jgi:hypothetical protein
MPSANSSSLHLNAVAAAPLPLLQPPQYQSKSLPQQAALPPGWPADAGSGLASAARGDASTNAPASSAGGALPGISDDDLECLLEQLGGCDSPADDFLA